jgi:probable HAF family extracellular repeat protein
MNFRNLRATSVGIARIGLSLAMLAWAGWPQEQAEAQQKHAKPAHYKVTDLGTLGGGYSEAFYMNNKGAIGGVASRADGSEHAFLWQDGTMKDLGTLGGPNSIAYGGPNLWNQLVGQSDTATEDPNGEDFCGFGTKHICQPFLWQPLPYQHGVLLALPTLGGHNGEANGINDLEEVVGTAENVTADTSCPLGTSLHQFKPVVWSIGQLRELGNYSGDPDGVAMGINDHGAVVGASGDCAAYNGHTGLNLVPRHALLWQKGTMTDLGNLGGTGLNGGILAFNINNRDEVVGLSDLPENTTFHAFLWTKQTGMQDLGTLHADDLGSSATGLDEEGNVVGLSLDSTMTPHAFLRLAGEKMIDINTLIPANSPLFLLQACSINSRGELTGLAIETSSGDLHAFQAIPIDADDDSSDAAASAERDSSGAKKKTGMTEGARKQLQHLLRFHLPAQPAEAQ